MLKQDVCKRGNQKPICLKRSTIPYFPSTRRWAMSYSPNQKPQAPGPFTLVQVLLLICLLLCLAVLTAPARTKHSMWVQNEDLTPKQAPDLQRLELLAPATAMTQHTTRAGGSSHSSTCHWHQQSTKGNTNPFISQHFKKGKKKFMLWLLFRQTCFCNWGTKLLFSTATQGFKCYNGGVLVDWLSDIIR